MTHLTLRNSKGKIFYSCRTTKTGGWILVDWKGSITMEQLAQGISKTLEFVEHDECQFLLQNFKKAEGNWKEIGEWLSNDWTTRALNCGLKYCAYVFSAKVTAQMSMVHFGSNSLKYEFRKFSVQKLAEEWLHQMNPKNK